jgi:hypothetical protein
VIGKTTQNIVHYRNFSGRIKRNRSLG